MIALFCRLIQILFGRRKFETTWGWFIPEFRNKFPQFYKLTQSWMVDEEEDEDFSQRECCWFFYALKTELENAAGGPDPH